MSEATTEVSSSRLTKQQFKELVDYQIDVLFEGEEETGVIEVSYGLLTLAWVMDETYPNGMNSEERSNASIMAERFV